RAGAAADPGGAARAGAVVQPDPAAGAPAVTGRATLTLIPRGDKLDALTEYEGGFDANNGAHVMAQALGAQLAEWLEQTA
ncbi:MAG: hypothetical protein ACO3C1_05125, partial [Ilumatobacteraceae bacterium]